MDGEGQKPSLHPEENVGALSTGKGSSFGDGCVWALQDPLGAPLAHSDLLFLKRWSFRPSLSPGAVRGPYTDDRSEKHAPRLWWFRRKCRGGARAVSLPPRALLHMAKVPKVQ